MLDPLVSVIMPAFNASKWIEDTLVSVIEQTWKNIEIIVVDDGSTDDTLAILKRINYKSLKIVTQENGGPCSARNRGFKEAQGKYIQFLDADDLISPQKIEKQVKRLENDDPNAICLSPIVYFFEEQNPLEGSVVEGWPFVDSNDPLEWLIDLLGGYNRVGMTVPGCWLLPREVVEKAGPWNDKSFKVSIHDDGEYFARVVLESSKIICELTERCYYRKYRTIGASVSTSYSAENNRAWLEQEGLIAKHLLSRTKKPEAMKAVCGRIMNVVVSSYPEFPEVTKEGLEKIRALGGTCPIPTLGGWRIETIKLFFGWKVARICSWLYRRKIRPVFLGDEVAV